MQSVKLIVDMCLPGMAGGKTTDIATIQKNVLAIQEINNKRLYSPGDIRPARVLVVTNIYHFICLININTRELKGYMSFISSRKSEYDALDIFNVLCPEDEQGSTEMKERFLQLYHHIKSHEADYKLHPIYFIQSHKALGVEMVY